jgi:hypothetical protein
MKFANSSRIAAQRADLPHDLQAADGHAGDHPALELAQQDGLRHDGVAAAGGDQGPDRRCAFDKYADLELRRNFWGEASDRFQRQLGHQQRETCQGVDRDRGLGDQRVADSAHQDHLFARKGFEFDVVARGGSHDGEIHRAGSQATRCIVP